MSFQDTAAFIFEDELFGVVLARYWDRSLSLDEWVDGELALPDEAFQNKYGELRFLMHEALLAQRELRA